MFISKCKLLYNIYLAYCLNIHIFLNNIHMFLAAIIFEKNCLHQAKSMCLPTHLYEIVHYKLLNFVHSSIYIIVIIQIQWISWTQDYLV